MPGPAVGVVPSPAHAHPLGPRCSFAGDADFLVPEVVDKLTTDSVLAMSFLPGVPVETLANAEPALRERVAGLLIRLLFREFFDFSVMQTNPNFANYRYDAASGRIALLDFGATRSYPPARMAQLRALMAAAVYHDPPGLEAAATALGYLSEHEPAERRRAVAELFPCWWPNRPVMRAAMTLAARTSRRGCGIRAMRWGSTRASGDPHRRT